ncbi:uncharacterized protein LOC115332033 [Ixodes scapularis]|uniref:uncharacterized protein LOC115332033 n=1 Tax=Ixodes scapularis TaxID=6945 RepID=UPI001A9EB745|nr:uncharacterized protein LOC115332033 [Ixodes scapularis]
MSCPDCKGAYHLGQTCSGIADKTFTNMGQSKRDKWICRTCRGRESQAGPSGGIEASQGVENLSAQPAAVTEKLDGLLTLKVSVDSLLSLSAQLNQLLLVKPLVESLRETINEIQQSMDFSADYDRLLKLATANEQTCTGLQDELSQLKSTVEIQAAKIQEIRGALNDNEQHSRLSNVEVHGLPVSPKEDLLSLIESLAEKLNISHFHKTDILAIHRLPAKCEKAPPILIRFASVSMKESWMEARGKLPSLSHVGPFPKLYLNDNLTRANKGLFCDIPPVVILAKQDVVAAMFQSCHVVSYWVTELL